jgi:hypothetical protein
VYERKKDPTPVFESVLLCGWQTPPAFVTIKERGEGQDRQTSNRDDLQYGIITADSFDRDILEGDDQHRQNEKVDTFRVGIRFCHMFTLSSSWVLPPPIERSGTCLIVATRAGWKKYAALFTG